MRKLLIILSIFAISCGGNASQVEEEQIYTTIYFLNCDGSAMDSVTVEWMDFSVRTSRVSWQGHDDKYRSDYAGRFITKQATEKDWIVDVMQSRRDRGWEVE